MKPKTIFVVNIVLALVAILLGYLIYQQQTGASLFTTDRTLQTSSPDLLTPLPGNLRATSLNETYVNETDVLNWPAPNASVEEKQRHSNFIQSIAQNTEYIDIVNCVAQPLVFRIQLGQTFVLRNQDAVDHTITIREEAEFYIPAGGTNSSTANTHIFEFGPGNYGYTCESQAGIAGIFFVVE